MKIDFANLQLQYQTYKEKIDSNIQVVLSKSNYILGEEVGILEKELQNFTGAKYAIACSSGTDALLLALMSLDIQPDDEIITTSFTWISTAEMMALIKANAPMVTPQTMVQFAPSVAPRFTNVFLYSFLRTISDLGLLTLVKTHAGPQKTPSSKVTPS